MEETFNRTIKLDTEVKMDTFFQRQNVFFVLLPIIDLDTRDPCNDYGPTLRAWFYYI